MPFPRNRPRRLRRSETLRAMVRETELSPRDFILPLFAMPGRGERREVASMPGVFQLSPDQILVEAKKAAGYFSAEPASSEADLTRVVGRKLEDF